MATIKKYKKKDGSTAYQFNAYLGIDPLTGKKKRTTRRGFKTQKEAKLALARLELEIDTQGFAQKHTATFKDVYELWYSQYVNTVKPTTAQNVEVMFRLHILPVLGEMRIQKVTKQVCQNTVNQWSQSFSDFGKLKSMTGKMLKYAVMNDIIENNPMDYIILPKKNIVIANDKIQFLELNDLNELLTIAKKQLDFKEYLIIRVLSFTGMRKGEVLALNWSDIDFKNKTVAINKTLSYANAKIYVSTTKTKHSNRTIGIDDLTLSELKQWKLKQKVLFLSYGIKTFIDNKQLIFSSSENSFLWSSYVNQIFSRRLKRNINPHLLRHTHASLLFSSGATIKDVQQRLGHSDISTTMNIYTHVTKESEKRTLDLLNKIAKT